MDRTVYEYNRKSIFLSIKVLVIISWIVGFVFGLSFGYITPSTTVSLMCNALCKRVSIVGRILSLFLPFFLSFLFIRKYVFLIIPVVALKAYSLGFCLYCVCSAFGTAGWLIAAICLFTDISCAALFLWFNLSDLQVSQKVITCRLTCCLIAVLLLGLLDYRVISPLGVKLLDY